MENSTDEGSPLGGPAQVASGDVPIPQMPSTREGGSVNAETVASLSIMINLVLLVTVFTIGHLLRRRKILVIHEAGVALGLGIVVGLTVKVAGDQDSFGGWINFNENFFFFFLLPPIIFESGWSLDPGYFFQNFGGICMFAFAGTIISTFAVGLFTWLGGLVGMTYYLPFLECLTYGALISATDPVTVLAIFNELGTDGNLYSLVFGESVLNDAVAIVMYKTVLKFVSMPISERGIFSAIWFFIAIFVGSFSIGALVGALSSLLFKYGGFHEKGLQVIECCIACLFPYMAYMLANGLGLSGIVAILFCGIAMRHYVHPNLSPDSAELLTGFFGMLAKLCESFVFIYMGVALFLNQQDWTRSLCFSLVSIFVILIARALNVYPCAWVVNHCRTPERAIPYKHQHGLWYSGLRGAMAFALALQSVTDLPGGHGRVLLTTTLFVIVFTVVVVGGSTTKVLDYLQVETEEAIQARGPPKRQRASLMKEDTENVQLPDLDISKPNVKLLEVKMKKKLKKMQQQATFQNIDQRFLRPLFVGNTASDDEASEGEPSGAQKDKVELQGAGLSRMTSAGLLMQPELAKDAEEAEEAPLVPVTRH